MSLTQDLRKCYDELRKNLTKIFEISKIRSQILLWELTVLFFTTYFLQQVLYRFIQSTNIMIAFNYVWLLFGNYCGPDLFDHRLQAMTESTWKILKLDWKTPGIFFIQKSQHRFCILQCSFTGRRQPAADWTMTARNGNMRKVCLTLNVLESSRSHCQVLITVTVCHCTT